MIHARNCLSAAMAWNMQDKRVIVLRKEWFWRHVPFHRREIETSNKFRFTIPHKKVLRIWIIDTFSKL